MSWPCKTCTFANEDFLSVCEMCGTAKADDGIVAIDSSLDDGYTAAQAAFQQVSRQLNVDDRIIFQVGLHRRASGAAHACSSSYGMLGRAAHTRCSAHCSSSSRLR